jgi:hypothetical protein
VAARRLVVGLELGQFPFTVTAIPEQHLVQKFSPGRPDQALDERVGDGHMWHRLDLVDLQNPQVRCLPVRLEEWIMVGTEMSRCTLTMNRGVEHAAEVAAVDRTAVHADADEATRPAAVRDVSKQSRHSKGYGDAATHSCGEPAATGSLEAPLDISTWAHA